MVPGGASVAMTDARKGGLAWAAVLLPVWAVMIICTHWEPVLRDSWNHLRWHRTHELDLANLWQFTKASYLHTNPRLGQVACLLLHAPGPWHPIVTPIIELGLFYLLTTLALGRWPSWRRSGDALVFATIIAMVLAGARAIGPMLFYRPFTGNYLFGLCLNLAWLVPYRLHAVSRQPRAWWWALPMLVLGFASGLCNEHTSPVVLLAGITALVVFWRRGERNIAWAWSGVLAMLGGTIALIFAPAQSTRYDGLATEQSIVERVVERGVLDNLAIAGWFLVSLLPLLIWIAFAKLGRFREGATSEPSSRRWVELLAIGMAVLVVLALFASPKQGDRLYFASTSLVCAAAASWVTRGAGPHGRRVLAAIASLAIAFVGFQLIATYRVGHREFTTRLARIEHAAPGTIVRVPHYSLERSRYWLGDDFEVGGVRAAVARLYGLAGVELDQREPTTVGPRVDEP